MRSTSDKKEEVGQRGKSLPTSGAYLLVALKVITAPGCVAACKAPQPDTTITTDRPTFANASTTVPCRALQLETGLLVSSKASQRGFDLPEASLRFGLADRSELHLGVPDYFKNYTSGAIPETGLGDLSVSEKQQVYLGSNGSAVALVGTLSFPTGAAAVSSYGYDTTLQLPASAKLSANTTVAGQAGVTWPTQNGRHNITGQVDVYFDQQFTKFLDAFVEYNGGFPQRGSPQHSLNFGGSYKVTTRQQVDVHAGFGLSSAVTDHFYGVGYSVRLGR